MSYLTHRRRLHDTACAIRCSGTLLCYASFECVADCLFRRVLVMDAADLSTIELVFVAVCVVD